MQRLNYAFIKWTYNHPTASTFILLLLSGFLGRFFITWSHLTFNNPPRPAVVEGLLLAVACFAIGTFRFHMRRARRGE